MKMMLVNLDWTAIEKTFMSVGYAHVPQVVKQRMCLDLIQSYQDDRNFRKRILMERHNFGVGDYAYFADPLPALIAKLRTECYRGLAPMANHVMQAMRQEHRYPKTLEQFLVQCHSQGQSQPTPLILHYEAGGMNRLHRDVYGPTIFPFQVMVMLNQKGCDFEGGEFVLVENRPRQQSTVAVLTPNQGDLVIFPVSERPIAGKRGMLRASVRHGVSRIHSGERWVLGIIFHNAS